MKILASSDWHGDWITHGVGRFADVENAVHQAVDRAIQESAEVFVFLGDLANPDSGIRALQAVRLAVQAATRLGDRAIRSIWLAGNHDVAETGEGETTISPLRGLDDRLVHVAEKPGRIPMFFGTREVVFWTFPFTETAFAYDPVEHARSISGNPKDNVVLAHMTKIEGVEPGEETREMSRGRGIPLPVDELKDRAGLIMNGHFHRRRKYGPVWIPGALARLSFCDEDYEPSYLLAEV